LTFIKCRKPYCNNEAEVGIKVCASCKQRQKEISKKCYDNKIANGQCIACKDKAVIAGRCQKCYDKLQGYTEKYKNVETQISVLEDLKNILDYDRNTGIFKWKIKIPGYKIGDEAGTLNGKYLNICLKGKRYAAHRLAWYYEHGSFPKNLIDHIDGNTINNRIDNLRPATHITNGQNMKKAMRNNKLGILGVCEINGFFVANIKSEGKLIRIGCFNTPEDAAAAYLAAKRILHEGNTL